MAQIRRQRGLPEHILEEVLCRHVVHKLAWELLPSIVGMYPDIPGKPAAFRWATGAVSMLVPLQRAACAVDVGNLVTRTHLNCLHSAIEVFFQDTLSICEAWHVVVRWQEHGQHSPAVLRCCICCLVSPHPRKHDAEHLCHARRGLGVIDRVSQSVKHCLA